MSQPREDGEDFKSYKESLKIEADNLKTYLKGRVFWNSKIRGTARRKDRALSQ